MLFQHINSASRINFKFISAWIIYSINVWVSTATAFFFFFAQSKLILPVNCFYASLSFFPKAMAVFFVISCWTRSGAYLWFFKDLCAHSCFGKSGIKLTAHWKGYPVTSLKRNRVTVPRLKCEACLSIFFSWLGSWLMQGSSARQQRAWSNRMRPSEVIGTDSLFACPKASLQPAATFNSARESLSTHTRFALSLCYFYYSSFVFWA